MGKPKAPTPTDPKETSAASTSTNVGTAIANAWLGNVNQVTPDGTLNYDQTGSYTWNDPYTGKTYDVPTFTATQTYSPEQQAIADQNNGASLNLATLANKQSGFINEYMDEPFKYDTGDHEAWALDLYDKQNSDKIAQNDEALRTRLANQGIKAGSEAYNRELGGMYDSVGNARNDFLLDSYQTGFSSAQAQRNQPINEITALMSGSQVSQPQFANTSMPTIPTTDTAGIISNYDNQKYNAYQQELANSQGLMGGLFGLGASALSLSDKRAKEDIKKIGKVDGNNVYRYKYKDETGIKGTHIGVMAQEAEKKDPSAVVEGADGLKRVNYGKLFSTGE